MHILPVKNCTIHFGSLISKLVCSLAIIGFGSLAKISSAYGAMEFTPQEKHQFVEAPHRFPEKQMPRLWPYVTHSHKYWIDDHRLIMTARELPNGWVAKPSEPSKIIILDTDTGKIDETNYRGDLECYSEDRMVIRTHPEGHGGEAWQGPPRHGEKILEGRLGGKLQQIDWPPGQELSDVGCQFVKWDTTLGYLRYRLLKNQGTLKVMHGRESTAWRLIFESPDGKVISQTSASFFTSPPGLHFEYLPFVDKYFVQAGAIFSFGGVENRFSGSLISSDGKIEPIDIPPFVSNIAGLEVTPWVTRKGILWRAIADRSYWKKQGLYLQEGDKTSRIDDGAIISELAISPDGCKAYFLRADGDPYDPKISLKEKFQAVVVNVCGE